MKVQENVSYLIQELFDIAPLASKMRGNPEYRNWARDLTILSQTQGLESIRTFVDAIVGDAFMTLDPINQFNNDQAGAVNQEVYLRASEVALAEIDRHPEAAFVLSLVAFFGWTQAVREHIERRPEGGSLYYKCWAHIPYACASAALALGAFDSARKLIDLAYEVLMMSATRYWFHTILRADLILYRRLASKAQEKLEYALSNLADELRESCQQGEYHFRAEFGALLWSLGMLPESLLFKSTSGSSFVPTRRLCKLIIRRSLNCIPHDPLVQYVWLAMKDRSPFNIRDHVTFFSTINRVYTYHDLLLGDVLYLISPMDAYHLYAQTLISWFQGSLSEELASEYLSFCQMMATLPPGPDWEIVQFRMAHFGYMLARERGLLKSPAQELEILRGMVSNSIVMRRYFLMQPEQPESYTRLDIPFFKVIENELSEAIAESELTEKAWKNIVADIEKFRASALRYWLQVSPPFQPPGEPLELAPLLERERQLLEYLRGAYFLLLKPILPQHYHYFVTDSSLWEEMRATPEVLEMTAEKGRQQYQELEKDLEALYAQMEAIVPGYVRKRRNPEAEVNDLIHALGSHTTAHLSE